ncbi:uncharacterized protein [Elaeis guineensis]|uniref:Uncharacterized protein LOC109505902 isoform X2 n=1 Tax=Elaeis guineensis var. tenera TaxID=51953 RepID=A0A8N4F8F4_ELAGV|nr:uncharacterized protein LOC109505902 isoform X2 [Elaeis guineensis]
MVKRLLSSCVYLASSTLSVLENLEHVTSSTTCLAIFGNDLGEEKKGSFAILVLKNSFFHHQNSSMVFEGDSKGGIDNGNLKDWICEEDNLGEEKNGTDYPKI